MAQADGLPPDGSTASTSSSAFRYIDDYVYLYSGAITVTDIITNLFEARSGNGFIVATVQFGYISDLGLKCGYRILLNDLVVQGYQVSGGDRYTSPDNPINLILPPFTKLTLDAANLASSADMDQAVSLTGRVYGLE